MVLCKLCLARQSASCWFCWLASFSEISHKIKLYWCFGTSKCRQVKLSSQMFRDWSWASVLSGRMFLAFLFFASLSLFLCFPFFFTLQTLKITFAHCAFVLSLVIPCHSFIMLSELGPLHCLRKCIVGLATSALLAKVRFSQLSVLWKDVGNLLYLHDLVFKHLPQAGLLTQLFPFSTISLLLPFVFIMSKSSDHLVFLVITSP